MPLEALTPDPGDDPDDGFADLSEERPPPEAIDLSEASLAEPCACPVPLAADGTCALCGHDLPGAVPEAA
jgi:hypothetical protein